MRAYQAYLTKEFSGRSAWLNVLLDSALCRLSFQIYVNDAVRDKYYVGIEVSNHIATKKLVKNRVLTALKKAFPQSIPQLNVDTESNIIIISNPGSLEEEALSLIATNGRDKSKPLWMTEAHFKILREMVKYVDDDSQAARAAEATKERRKKERKSRVGSQARTERVVLLPPEIVRNTNPNRFFCSRETVASCLKSKNLRIFTGVVVLFGSVATIVDAVQKNPDFLQAGISTAVLLVILAMLIYGCLRSNESAALSSSPECSR